MNTYYRDLEMTRVNTLRETVSLRSVQEPQIMKRERAWNFQEVVVVCSTSAQMHKKK